MCKKKSGSVWVPGGSEESKIFIKFINCCYLHYLFGPICPTIPPSPTRLWKIVLPDVLRCHFVQMPQTLRHVQNPHFQTILITPISALWTYSEMSNRCLKSRKRFTRNISAPETGRNCSDCFSTLNDDCSAKDETDVR